MRRPKFLSSCHPRHWYHDSAKIISSLSDGYAALRVLVVEVCLLESRHFTSCAL